MSDLPVPVAPEVIRKRSRSSSPGADSPAAAKKPNTDSAAPSVPSAPVDPSAEPTPMQTDAEAAEVKTEEPAAMLLDSSLPAVPAADGVPAPLSAEAIAAAEAAAAAAAVIQMRALIVTQDASIIIGKQGKNVNEIREKSGSKITISEAVPGNPERVMVVAGQLDAVSKAFGLVVRRINDEPFDVPSVPGSRAVTIRFIIPNSRMGSVIGKSGSKIKEIQEASGARLQASEAMLPGSTERVLSVSGVADAIHIAVYYIGTILQEHPLPATTHTTYRPTGGNQPYQGGVPGGAGGQRAPAGYGQGYPSGAGGQNIGPAGTQTQQIFIPNELVGSIIGKGGQKINEIRQMSACQIKICEPGDGSPGANASERLVTIQGAHAGIQMAVSLLYQRLEQEKQKQLGGA